MAYNGGKVNGFGGVGGGQGKMGSDVIDADLEQGQGVRSSFGGVSGKIGSSSNVGGGISTQQQQQNATSVEGSSSNAGGGGAAEQIKAVFDSSAHPIALGCLLFFKTLPVLAFVLGGLFVSSSVLNFVLIILFSSAEFWVVKNVSGRLLVGLRWWNEVREDGRSVWLFESRDVSQWQYLTRTFSPANLLYLSSPVDLQMPRIVDSFGFQSTHSLSFGSFSYSGILSRSNFQVCPSFCSRLR